MGRGPSTGEQPSPPNPLSRCAGEGEHLLGTRYSVLGTRNRIVTNSTKADNSGSLTLFGSRDRRLARVSFRNVKARKREER
jgi:hypothetical protein